ncbi:hypothetical protein HYN56_17265 [Flavobacterium crocinum]|uniref:Uncharacterized protein n=1 Tax=Flavobacterium crocinum TaxID=2183896 RepID=A0A2S1YPF2_9FLAO|nr:hypothetical protein HYN56_17265 [Flavobacterium crocinum]
MIIKLTLEWILFYKYLKVDLKIFHQYKVLRQNRGTWCFLKLETLEWIPFLPQKVKAAFSDI